MRTSVLFFIGIMMVLAAFTACTKSTFTGDQTPARLRLINAMPGKSFDLALNQKSLLSDIPYDSATPYANGAAGFYQLSISEHGSEDLTIEGNQYLQAGANYSLFMIPDSSSNATLAKLSVVTDNHILPQFDSAKVRFLHFSPNGPSVNFVQVKERGTSNIYDTAYPLFLDRTYLDNGITSSVAQYTTIHTDKYIFNFFESEPPLKIVTQPLTVQIEKGKFYTFYLEGYAGRPGADSLKAVVQVTSF